MSEHLNRKNPATEVGKKVKDGKKKKKEEGKERGSHGMRVQTFGGPVALRRKPVPHPAVTPVFTKQSANVFR